MMAGASLSEGYGGFTPSIVSPGPGPEPRYRAAGQATPGANGPGALAQQFLGGVNPVPFVVALVAMGVVMLAYPKAAVPLAAIIVLGAFAVDRQALASFEAWQKGQRQ